MTTGRAELLATCGRCGQPEDAHKYATGEDEEAINVLAALGGPCTRFVVSDAAVLYQKYLAITDNRAPQRKPGTIGKRNPLCRRCGHRQQGECPL
jgi:hypothetical protein